MEDGRMDNPRIAVIGGSGLYSIEGIRVVGERDVPTPFGMPSDAVTLADVGGATVAFLPRHGRGHRILPGEVNSRANIWALKSLGVQQVISISAVGSLSGDIAPGTFVLADQLVDRTTGRRASFFGDGLVGHVSFAEPFCPGMRERIGRVLAKGRHAYHDGGTYVCMEGPAFSTRAESRLHRSWDAALIGMTALPEAKLAREAELCYATIAMVTDWDSWKESEEGVTLGEVVATMRANVRDIQGALPGLVGALADRDDCPCRHAAEQAMMTDLSVVPYETRRRVALLYRKYWAGK